MLRLVFCYLGYVVFVELVWLMFACDCDVNLVIWFVGGVVFGFGG